jgi:hypothetical protein
LAISALYDTTAEELGDAPVISVTHTTTVILHVGCGIVEALMDWIFL